jgi:hypothetical protein
MAVPDGAWSQSRGRATPWQAATVGWQLWALRFTARAGYALFAVYFRREQPARGMQFEDGKNASPDPYFGSRDQLGYVFAPSFVTCR